MTKSSCTEVENLRTVYQLIDKYSILPPKGELLVALTDDESTVIFYDDGKPYMWLPAEDFADLIKASKGLIE